MKTVLNSAFPAPKLMTKCLVKALVLGCALFAVAGTPDHPVPTKMYPFLAEATGPFTVTPVSATVVRDDQDMSFTSATPFPLTTGFVQGFDDLTIPTFPDRFFGGTLAFYGQGHDAVFGTVTVQTSVFSDPVDPLHGDFFGSEDFTGTFTITGGTGRYLNAAGSGTYVAHSEWRSPTVPGTLFSGFSTITVTGTVLVVPKSPNAP